MGDVLAIARLPLLDSLVPNCGHESFESQAEGQGESRICGNVG